MRVMDRSKYRKWPEGQPLVLQGKRARRVRLQVTAPHKAILMCGTFPLAVVEGPTTVEFAASEREELWLVVDGEPVRGAWFHTVDGDHVAFDHADLPEFTRPFEKRPRDLNLERILRAQQENADRRMQQMLEMQENRLRNEFTNIERRKGAESPAGKGKSAKAGSGSTDAKRGAGKAAGGDGDDKGAKADGAADV